MKLLAVDNPTQTDAGYTETEHCHRGTIYIEWFSVVIKTTVYIWAPGGCIQYSTIIVLNISEQLPVEMERPDNFPLALKTALFLLGESKNIYKERTV